MKRQLITWCSNTQLRVFNESGYVAVQVIAERKDKSTHDPLEVDQYLCLLEIEAKE